MPLYTYNYMHNIMTCPCRKNNTTTSKGTLHHVCFPFYKFSDVHIIHQYIIIYKCLKYHYFNLQEQIPNLQFNALPSWLKWK